MSSEKDVGSTSAGKSVTNSITSQKYKSSLLSNIDISELRSIKVALNRGISNPEASHPRSLSPLKRKLRHPRSLKVHLEGTSDEKKEQRKPLFARPDIVVNKDEDERKEQKPYSSDSHSDGYASRSPSPQKRRETRPNKDRLSKSKPIFKHYINKSPPYELPPEPPEHNQSPSPEKRKDTYSGRHYRKGDKKSFQQRTSRSRSSSSSSSDRDPKEHREASRYDHRPYSMTRYSEKSPPLRPGEYRPSKTRPRSPEEDEPSKSHIRPHSHEERPSSSTRTRHRSPEYRPPSTSHAKYHSPEHKPRHHESERGKLKTNEHHHSSSTSRRNRSRSLSKSKIGKRSISRSPPLKPGEYRPPRKNSSRPPAATSRNRNRRETTPTSGTTRARYPPTYHHPPWYEPRMRFPVPLHHGMRFPGPRFPPHPHMRPHPPPIIIQYIPVPTPVSSTGLPFGQIIRPPKIYNNRVIPRLVPTTTASSVTVSTPSEPAVKD